MLACFVGWFLVMFISSIIAIIISCIWSGIANSFLKPDYFKFGCSDESFKYTILYGKSKYALFYEKLQTYVNTNKSETEIINNYCNKKDSKIYDRQGNLKGE